VSRSSHQWLHTGAGNFANDLWFDIIDLEGASALANFENDFYAGLPAVTKNQFGQGQAFYVGTRLDQDGLAWLLKEVTQAAGVAPVLDVPQGIEAVRRSNGANEFLYLLNHNLQATTVAFGGQATELLSGSELDGSITLDARGVAILQLR
jgi:beta-galactosidase